MSLVVEVTVGKKHAIYLPKVIVNKLNLKESDKLIIQVKGSILIMKPVIDPIRLALHGSKFAKIKPEQVEVISLEEQEKYTKSTP